MEVKILKLKQITKEIAKVQLSNTNLSYDVVDEYLDVLSAIKNDKTVYAVSTSNGEYLLYVTAKETKIDIFNKI